MNMQNSINLYRSTIYKIDFHIPWRYQRPRTASKATSYLHVSERCPSLGNVFTQSWHNFPSNKRYHLFTIERNASIVTIGRDNVF
jgi:hypothetical protein